MRYILASLALLCAPGLLWSRPASAITIETVPVGNPGNGNDPNTGNLYGGVDYNYSIGKYDVTVGQYTAFLNAVAATDTYGLYNNEMTFDLNVAGIAQNGVSGGHTYSVIGSPNHPITFVSWGDAARFSNWLANGQPTGGETLSTTEDGSYFLNGATTDSALNAVTRKVSASWVIPSENEWYKAAYHKNDGVTNNYWSYATGTNTTPTSTPPGSTPNTANFYGDTTGYAVDGSTSYSLSQNYLTDVGGYTASASPYGTFDQGGNVYQWNEGLIDDSYRGERGGSWFGYWYDLQSLGRGAFTYPTSESFAAGFRVATLILRGDMNFDGHVNAADISAMELALTNLNGYLSTNFGGGDPSSHGVTAANVGNYADVNGGTKFDISDLQALLQYLKGGHGSAESVPEPSTAVLAGVAFGLMLWWRKSTAASNAGGPPSHRSFV